jgi:hypothetical protein
MIIMFYHILESKGVVPRGFHEKIRLRVKESEVGENGQSGDP